MSVNCDQPLHHFFFLFAHVYKFSFYQDISIVLGAISWANLTKSPTPNYRLFPNVVTGVRVIDNCFGVDVFQLITFIYNLFDDI